MKIFCLITLLLVVSWATFFSFASAQDTSFAVEPHGINLSVNPHLAPLGTASKALNLHKPYGVLTGREGFSVWTTGIAGIAQSGYFSGLYAFQPRTEGKRLMAVFQYNTSEATFKSYPYAFILQSSEYGRNIATGNAIPFHYRGSGINCATYNDMMFIGRKYGIPLRFAGGSMEPLIDPGPGRFEYTPMAETTTTNNLLDGKYWYATRMAVYSTGGTPDSGLYFPPRPESLNLGGLYGPIIVDSDWVFIHNIQGPTSSATHDYDTLVFQVCRTKANGEWNDPFFVVKQCTIQSTYLDTATAISAFHFIDSLKDDNLSTFAGFFDTTTRYYSGISDMALDSIGMLGAINWITTDTIDGKFWTGISEGYESMDSGSWGYTVYAVAYYDSATGGVSPMGPITKIPVVHHTLGTAVDTIKDSAIQIELPPLSGNKDHLWRLLLRSRVDVKKTTVTDTLFISDDYMAALYTWGSDLPIEGGVLPINQYVCLNPATGRYSTNGAYQRTDGSWWCATNSIHPYDTVMYEERELGLRIIDTIKNATDSVYGDDMPWSKWNSKPAFFPSMTPIAMNYPAVFKDRVVMASGNRVYFNYWTQNGSEPGIWFADYAFDVNVDDGDEITGILPWGDYLYVFKNNSFYRVQEYDMESYSISSYVSGIGCVAPQSLASVPGGGICFLHTSGLYILTGPLQSQFKDVSGQFTVNSMPIQSLLDKYTLDDLREAIVWFDDNDRDMVLSFPTLDTSFVLSNGEWFQWDYAPRAVVKYDTAYTTYLRPDNQRLFILDSTNKIYKFGSVATDTGASFNKEWQSVSMLHGEPSKIIGFNVWKWSNDTAGISFTVYDIDGDSVAYVVDSTHSRVRYTHINAPESRAHGVRIKSSADSLAVERIDIQVQPRGKSEVH